MSSTILRFRAAIPTTSSKPIDQSFLFNPVVTKTTFLKNKKCAWNLHGRSCRNLKYLSMSINLQTATFVRQSNINPPPEPLPSGPPSGSLRNWIVGLVLTFVLPFFTHKWGSWLLLKNKVDQKIETTEHVVKAVESIAERVDKVIDGITDELPKGSKLRKALEFADEIAEGVAKTAHVADDLINKVEEAEDELESLIHHEKSKEEYSKGKEDNEIAAQEEDEKK